MSKVKQEHKGIRGVILRLAILPSVILGVILTSVSSAVSFNLITSQYKEESASLAASYATSVDNLIDTLVEDLDMVGRDPDIVDESIPLEERKASLAATADVSTFKDFSVSYADGKTYNDTDISNREYFKYAMQNKSYYISSPVLRLTDNKLTIMMGRYFTANGNDYLAYGGLDLDVLNKTIGTVHFGENGICFLVDKDGMIISSSDDSLLPVMTTLGGDYDAKYEGVASFVGNMTAGESGSKTVKLGGEKYLFSYIPMEGNENWSIAVGAPTKPVAKSITSTALIFVGILILAVLLIVASTTIRSKYLCKPIVDCADRLRKLSEGDVESPAPECNEKNEIRVMSDALGSTVTTLGEYIGDIRRVLTAIADGDLTVKPSAEYLGNFSAIKDSLNLIVSSLGKTMSDVSRSATEVREGASQLSEGSVTLSQNAITQASAVDQITSTIIDITKKIEENNKSVEKALDSSRNTNAQAQDGVRCMNDLLDAIREIENRSQEIENIIKVIDDIAFQTNILSLNAAIEAARAGDAGKGFAVVADEVRNLASKSSEAAQQTGQLINKSIEAVSRGTELANTASTALSGIVSGVEEVTGVMTEISTASSEQAVAAEQISSGMENVNSAIHDTTATAEQSAAASEELSALAVTLSDTVSRFRYEE